MAASRSQTWEMVHQRLNEILETGDREPVDNIIEILGSKLDTPFRLSLESNILTINPSEIQTLKSGGAEWGSTVNSFKVGGDPQNKTYFVISPSTIDFTSGATTGSSSSCSFIGCLATFAVNGLSLFTATLPLVVNG